MLCCHRRFAFSFRRIFSGYGSSNISPSEYCMNLVKQYDHENFLCTLLLPNEVRRAALSIRAFNIEVARIEDLTTEERIGDIRYKWWENTLESIFSGGPVPQHPVVLELNKVVKDHKLMKKHFSRLLAARSRSIPKGGFETMSAMETYAEESTSPVYYLILHASGLKNMTADHAASHLGKAQGIVNLIRAIPHHVTKRKSVVPVNLMVKHDVPQETMLSGQMFSSSGVRNVIFDIAAIANSHINLARKLSSEVPKEAKLVLLPAVSVALYLERLRDTDFDVHFCSKLQKDTRLGLRLFWNKLKWSY